MISCYVKHFEMLCLRFGKLVQASCCKQNSNTGRGLHLPRCRWLSPTKLHTSSLTYNSCTSLGFLAESPVFHRDHFWIPLTSLCVLLQLSFPKKMGLGVKPVTKMPSLVHGTVDGLIRPHSLQSFTIPHDVSQLL